MICKKLYLAYFFLPKTIYITLLWAIANRQVWTFAYSIVMNITKTVGVNIRRLRLAKKLSQEELAFEAGIDRSYLSEIENGYKNVGVTVLQQIAKALDVSVASIVSELE